MHTFTFMHTFTLTAATTPSDVRNVDSTKRQQILCILITTTTVFTLVSSVYVQHITVISRNFLHQSSQTERVTVSKLTWSYEWQNTELPLTSLGRHQSFADRRPMTADTNTLYNTPTNHSRHEHTQQYTDQSQQTRKHSTIHRQSQQTRKHSTIHRPITADTNTLYNWLAVWLSGNALASINVVALRQTRLVLGWVTVCGRVNHFGM